MKSIKPYSILLLSLMLVFITSCNKKEDKSKNKSKETTFYTCSMDPQVKEDKPGKCPICNMDLTAIKSSDTNPNEITLSEQQLKLGNITTQIISATQNTLTQNYTGELTLNQENTNTISARTMGRINKLYFKTVGDYVQKNQPIYQIYSEDIAIAKQDYLTAYQQITMPGNFGINAKKMLDAAQQKLLFFGLSNTQIQNIKTTKEVSPNTIFYSNVSGTVSEIFATEGSYVMEGGSIMSVTNLGSLWLETQVNVSYAKKLKIGQNAEVTFVDFPEKAINAKVNFINPEINPNSRLMLIRLEISNPNLQLKPGMQAIAKLTQSNIKGIFLPTDAIIREENASYIWLEKKTGIFENVMIETGIEMNGMIEIKSEMNPSSKVVITGAYAINSEYKFRKGSSPMEGMKM